MQVEVRGKRLTVSESMRTHAERRLRFALGRFDAQLRRVRVRLEDMNGPRGGVDKRCAIELTGPRLGTVFVEAKDANVLAAIDAAAQAVARVVTQAVARVRPARAQRARAQKRRFWGELPAADATASRERAA